MLFRSKRKYTMSHLINALRMSIHLKNQGHMKKATVASVRYLHPRNFKQVFKTLQKDGHCDPAKLTMLRTRLKFDVAAMIRHRRWAQDAVQINRYLVCDASPQRSQSYEVFVTRERVVKHIDLTARCRLNMNSIPVFTRTLPVCCLGHGEAGVRDKTMAQVHQT